MNKIKIQWFPNKEILPENDMYCLVTTKEKTIMVAKYRYRFGDFYGGVVRNKLNVIAWSYLPEAYTEDSNGKENKQ